MNKIVKLSSIAVAFAFLMVALISSVPARAADTKVAVINIQKVLVESEAGKKAKAKV